MKIKQKQMIFMELLPRLIDRAHKLGFGVVGGHLFRSKKTAAAYAKDGSGIANSLHTKCLAIDLNLFRGAKYLTDSDDYKELGAWWESQGQNYGVETAWGGRFKRQDGGHFSIAHKGVR